MSRESAYRRRIKNVIPKSGMADIGLMVLVVFMIMTSWETDDYGIELNLPRWVDEESFVGTKEVPQIILVDINDRDQLMINGESIEIRFLQASSKTILEWALDRIAEDARYGYVVLRIRVNRDATYERYIHVLNEVIAARNKILDNAAMERYQLEYKQLELGQKKVISSQNSIRIEDVNFHVQWYCCE